MHFLVAQAKNHANGDAEFFERPRLDDLTSDTLTAPDDAGGRDAVDDDDPLDALSPEQLAAIDAQIKAGTPWARVPWTRSVVSTPVNCVVARPAGAANDRHGRAAAPCVPWRHGARQVPPHNLEAEASMLGAALLSPVALDVASDDGLAAEDFYRPAHQHIYDAMVRLAAVGEPIDVITVAHRLREDGLLDQIGGLGLLHTLQNATPAISNAVRYARIIRKAALLRRLIHVASDISELAYSSDTAASEATLDEAEQRLHRLTLTEHTATVAKADLLIPAGSNDSKHASMPAAGSPVSVPASPTSTTSPAGCNPARSTSSGPAPPSARAPSPSASPPTSPSSSVAPFCSSRSRCRMTNSSAASCRYSATSTPPAALGDARGTGLDQGCHRSPGLERRPPRP